MAKKTTRQRKEIAAQRGVQQAVANVSMAAARPSAPAAAPIPSTQAKPAVDYAAQYAYVRSDLRRIALLAVAIVAVLVVLSFVF